MTDLSKDGRDPGGPDVNEPDTPDLKRVMGPKLLLLFIVGDILGAGIYAVTGKLAGQVGGIAWLPFLVAFAVATITAFSYLELVTKYPQAAGAALYTHKAFGVHFITFIVAFTVVCSGITSASTSSGLLASNLLIGLDEIFPGIPTGDTATLLVALGFMVLLAAINLRGVGESVKFNVVLTIIEMTALAIVIVIGFLVVARGDGTRSGRVDGQGAGRQGDGRRGHDAGAHDPREPMGPDVLEDAGARARDGRRCGGPGNHASTVADVGRTG